MERDNSLIFSEMKLFTIQKWYRKNITHTYGTPPPKKPTSYEEFNNDLCTKKDNALKTAFNMIHEF